MALVAHHKDTVIITGVARLATSYNVIGLDRRAPNQLPSAATFEEIDLTSDRNIRQSLEKICKHHGGRIASVIHLAAYFDLTGQPNPEYQEITVRGNERLLLELQSFDVDQFVFVSSMLVHRAGRQLKPAKGLVVPPHSCGSANHGELEEEVPGGRRPRRG